MAPGELSPAVSDPPVCSVLQMGGGAVQTRAAGVHGGVPAAGLGTTNNDTHYTHTHVCTTVPAKDLLSHVGGGEGGAQIRPE